MTQRISEFIDTIIIVLFKVALFIYFFVVMKCVKNYCVIF